MRVAVIGAGLAGLSAARTLRDQDHDVRVFDKGRGVGGRTSTRRSSSFAFDHGAQYFTAHDERFGRLVASWQEAGIVAPWPARITVLENGACRSGTPRTRYVGVPGMNAIARHLAAGLDIALGIRITGLSHDANGWRLVENNGPVSGVFDVVIAALPAAQTAELLAGLSNLAESAQRCPIAPCWAVMLGFDRPLATTYDGAFVHDSPISWIARNNSKPGRGPAESWVLHAGPAWSSAYLDDSPEAVASTLTGEFEQLIGLGALRPIHTDAHRWRHALPPDPLAVGALCGMRAIASRCAVTGVMARGSRVHS